MESQNVSVNGLDDNEEDQILVTALATPQPSVAEAEKGIIDQKAHEVVGVDVAQLAGKEAEEQSEPISLDLSLIHI